MNYIIKIKNYIQNYKKITINDIYIQKLLFLF